MTKTFLKKKFDHSYLDTMAHIPLSYPELSFILFNVAVKMWDEVPQYIALTKGNLYSPDLRLDTDPAQEKYVNGEEKEYDRNKDILSNNTYNKCKKYLEENNIVFVEYRYDSGNFLLTENKEIILNEYSNIIVFKTGDITVPEWIDECIVRKSTEDSTYEYLIFDSEMGGFTTMSLKVNNREVDIESNYNDDIPDKEIRNFLESEDSGIVILHGDPGTGKSTYIRHLISNVDNKFMYLDQTSVNSITDASFIKTLIGFENNVLILEDCEKLLIEREESSNNASLAALLNLTDGLLGDSFKFKVICTFNTDLKRIDKALTRKGRLKVRYMFDKLTADKASKLAQKLELSGDFSKPMHLADVYNYLEQVEFNKNKEKKTIGFGN